MTRNKNWLATLFAVGLLGGAAAISAPGPTIAKQEGPAPAAVAGITSSQLKEALKRKHFFLVNVHVPYEGEIERTDAFIAYDKIPENLRRLPKDKNAEIVVYCRTGRMSALAARELRDRGYKRVFELKGGMNDWARSGYPIIKK